jgi:pimeloyl-ACP methyl ester carboxylesterase
MLQSFWARFLCENHQKRAQSLSEGHSVRSSPTLDPRQRPDIVASMADSQTGRLRVLRRQPLDSHDSLDRAGCVDAIAHTGDSLATGASAGRRLVLVHGSMDRASSFTRLMARLRDWNIVAYDRRGYAGSASTGPPASFDDQVEDLITVLDGEGAVAFGHSFGGDVVLAAAAEHPDLIPAAVVWEPPQPWLPLWADSNASRGLTTDLETAERAEWFMRRMVGDRVWERLPASTRAQRRSEGRTLRAEINSLADAPAFEAASVRIPVIVGRGGLSSAHQRRAARELAATLPFGQLVEIAEAGHGAHLSHSAEVAALLERVAASA